MNDINDINDMKTDIYRLNGRIHDHEDIEGSIVYPHYLPCYYQYAPDGRHDINDINDINDMKTDIYRTSLALCRIIKTTLL